MTIRRIWEALSCFARDLGAAVTRPTLAADLRADLAEAESEAADSRAASELLTEALTEARGELASERVEVTRLNSALGDRRNTAGRLISEAERLAGEAESDLAEAESIRADARAEGDAMAETVSRLAALARESYPALNVGRVLADTIRREDGSVAFTGGDRRLPPPPPDLTRSGKARRRPPRKKHPRAHSPAAGRAGVGHTVPPAPPPPARERSGGYVAYGRNPSGGLSAIARSDPGDPGDPGDPEGD